MTVEVTSYLTALIVSTIRAQCRQDGANAERVVQDLCQFIGIRADAILLEIETLRQLQLSGRPQEVGHA
jgi:hypothetical protein